MEADAITNWTSLALAFYKRCFQPQITNALRSPITSFKQGPNKDFNEAWFLKEILSKKRSFDEVETIAFTHECNAALQANSPPKLKDPRSFSIACTIGPLTIDNVLCDLGENVSVMPYKICNKLNMMKLKCTNMALQMADMSIKHPMGILEDIPVRIGKFFILVDFVVIDIAEDSRVPIILG
ncbi:uncharacterized protein LOC141655371 [Silene latifolia]|uniref:uncharacterized protein LOC141655371 n=1 Tax=Silene latifolia TaxID=37657 RepID=UPI003D773D72